MGKSLHQTWQEEELIELRRVAANIPEDGHTTSREVNIARSSGKLLPDRTDDGIRAKIHSLRNLHGR